MTSTPIQHLGSRWRLPFSTCSGELVHVPRNSAGIPRNGERFKLPSGQVVAVLGLLSGGHVELGYLRHGKVVPKGRGGSGRVSLTLAFLRQYGRPA